jgi:predicted metal-dependent enzyme (double-stranded beta helix superfamily)
MTITDPTSEVRDRIPVPPALKRFIWDIQSMVELAESEREILVIGRDLMARLIASDDWLPTIFAAPDSVGGRQFQIYSDGLERFSIVSSVLAGGTALAIEQPAIWEIAGVLRGAVAWQQPGGAETKRILQPGAMEVRSSRTSDAVQLSNALNDNVSVCIHVYGGEIGRLNRRPLKPNGQSGEQAAGYANTEEAPPYDIMSIQTEIRD